jgi:hypothetical protein
MLEIAPFRGPATSKFPPLPTTPSLSDRISPVGDEKSGTPAASDPKWRKFRIRTPAGAGGKPTGKPEARTGVMTT